MSILEDCDLELWDACFDNGSMSVHINVLCVGFDDQSITWLFLLRINTLLRVILTAILLIYYY